ACSVWRRIISHMRDFPPPIGKQNLHRKTPEKADSVVLSCLSRQKLVSAKRDQILSLAARFTLPTMFLRSIDAREGGGFTLCPDPIEVNRQIGAHTGRFLKGEKPADLPVMHRRNSSS